jgi:hypothetical protein
MYYDCPPIPALLTRTSILPNCLTAFVDPDRANKHGGRRCVYGGVED